MNTIQGLKNNSKINLVLETRTLLPWSFVMRKT